MHITTNSESMEFERIRFQCVHDDVFHSVALPILESMFIAYEPPLGAEMRMKENSIFGMLCKL